MDPMSLKFSQKQAMSLKQMQRLIMSPQMQQALQMMQVPIMELSMMLQSEMEQNPVLEYDEIESEGEPQEIEIEEEKELDFRDDDLEIMQRLDEDFRDHFAESENYSTQRSADEEKLKLFLEQSVRHQETLYEHLKEQATQTFETETEREIAEVLIGNIDKSGFLTTPLEEITLLTDFKKEDLESILKEIQTFDPFGVGATSLQESLLIQLRCRNQEDTLAYKIIENHYEDLLHNRIPEIKKGLLCTVEEIKYAIEHQISLLELHPGSLYSSEVTQQIAPDASIKGTEDNFEVVINDDYIPTLRLNSRYLRMLEDKTLPQETREFIRDKLMSAKWLLKNIDQRNETLYRVVSTIVKHQHSYLFKTDGKIVPLTMKTIADELDIHESTVARSVSNKYVDTPKGLLSLRSFFTNAYTTTEGVDISSKTVRDALKKIIDQENKKRPLSDELISQMLEKKGITCARRTVAKYRAELKIGNTRQRRQY